MNLYTSEELHKDIKDLRRTLFARCILIADDAANIIALEPSNPDFDTSALAALTVANLSATRQIASLVDKSKVESPQLLLVEAPLSRIFLGSNGKGLFFAAVLGEESPLGLARLVLWDFALRLQAFIQPEEPTYDAQEKALVDGLLDSLDDMWGENLEG